MNLGFEKDKGMWRVQSETSLSFAKEVHLRDSSGKELAVTIIEPRAYPDEAYGKVNAYLKVDDSVITIELIGEEVHYGS